MVKEEIQKANILFARYGEKILQDGDFSELLKGYHSAIESTWNEMKGLDINRVCAACSDKWAGGCCFRGVENWYDKILFLINLLLGADIEASGNVQNGCIFVGTKGCTLPARHSFCINYLCDALKLRLSVSDQTKLMALGGEEILYGIQVEQYIRKWIRKN